MPREKNIEVCANLAGTASAQEPGNRPRTEDASASGDFVNVPWL